MLIKAKTANKIKIEIKIKIKILRILKNYFITAILLGGHQMNMALPMISPLSA